MPRSQSILYLGTVRTSELLGMPHPMCMGTRLERGSASCRTISLPSSHKIPEAEPVCDREVMLRIVIFHVLPQWSTMLRLLRAVTLFLVGVALAQARSIGSTAEPTAGSLRISVFQADATPPLGTPVAYALARKIEDPLTARGIVLLGVGKPVVLCAVDWIAIANGGHDLWRESLARAVGTSVDRVTVHVLHQHDGVRCDFSAEELLTAQGLGGKRFDVLFVRKAIADAAQAAKASLESAQPVTHLGVGEAKVEKVASNRRILGPNGRVAIARASSYRIPEPILSRLVAEAQRQGYEHSASRVEEALAAPEGVIDPLVTVHALESEGAGW